METGCAGAFSAREIFEHPRFAEVRRRHVDGFASFFGYDRSALRLMINSGRLLTCSVLMGLHASRDPQDRSTWPTPSRVQSLMEQGGWASPRQVTEILARIRSLGYLKTEFAAGDRRMKVLVPAQSLVDLDRAFVAAHIGGLDILHPDGRYRPLVEGDPAAHMAYRKAWFAHLGQTRPLLNGNPEMIFLWSRHAGYMAFILVVQEHLARGHCSLRFADIADRLGVSRTHVRAIFSEGASLGLFELPARGGREIVLLPRVLEAFDRLVAEMGAGYDRITAAMLNDAAPAAETPARPL